MQIRKFAIALGLSVSSMMALSSSAQTSSQMNTQSASGNTLSENEAAAAQLDHPVKITSAAMDAMALTKVPPVYPQEAKDQALEGSVIMWAVINEDGTVKSLDILSGPETFRIAALTAVNQWKYTPYMVNGQAVKMAAPIAINFKLNN